MVRGCCAWRLSGVPWCRCFSASWPTWQHWQRRWWCRPPATSASSCLHAIYAVTRSYEPGIPVTVPVNAGPAAPHDAASAALPAIMLFTPGTAHLALPGAGWAAPLGRHCLAQADRLDHGGRLCPICRKMVLLVAAAAPSNWDGIHMLAGILPYQLRWMGKASLTKGIFGGLVRWAGCVPSDRTRSNDVVADMRAAFATNRSMVLAVPPECRSHHRMESPGFYHIAHGASVPLVFSVLDYAVTIRIAGSMMTSGDYDADLPLILRLMRTRQASIRQSSTRISTAPQDRAPRER